MSSSFKEEDPMPKDEVELEIIVIRPLSTEPSTHSTSLSSCCYGQAIFPTPTPIFSITTTTSTLPTPSFQDSFEDFSLLHFPVHSTLDSSSISLSRPPSYSDFLSSLTFHTSTDKPVSSSFCTLTSPLPSSLPPSYPIYRPIPIYTPPGPLAFLWGPSLTYILLFFPPTPYLYLIMAAPPPGSLLPPLSLPPVVPRKGAPAAGPETAPGTCLETIPITLPGGNVPGLPLLATPFPYFLPGPIPLVIEITP